LKIPDFDVGSGSTTSALLKTPSNSGRRFHFPDSVRP
jgi:hypothetical protein